MDMHSILRTDSSPSGGLDGVIDSSSFSILWTINSCDHLVTCVLIRSCNLFLFVACLLSILSRKNMRQPDPIIGSETVSHRWNQINLRCSSRRGTSAHASVAISRGLRDLSRRVIFGFHVVRPGEHAMD